LYEISTSEASLRKVILTFATPPFRDAEISTGACIFPIGFILEECCGFLSFFPSPAYVMPMTRAKIGRSEKKTSEIVFIMNLIKYGEKVKSTEPIFLVDSHGYCVIV
jgi:hypothetical protein